MLDSFLLNVVPLYIVGLGYSVIGGMLLSVGFAILRWGKCVQHYVEKGTIDTVGDSWFMVENNWFHGSRTTANFDYGNHPWVVAADILVVSIMTTILSLAWPVTIIAFSVIAYAKIARVRFARKKEFMERLQGEHVEA